MGFTNAETAGMMGAAAANAGLAGQTAGGAGQAGAAGAVVPPGLEVVSAANAAKIAAYTAEVASLLGVGATIQGLYGASVSGSATALTVTDALSAIGLSL